MGFLEIRPCIKLIMDTKTIKANAKINLGLEILNKRQDSYHNINSAITRLSLADTLSFCKNKEILVNSIPNLGIQKEQNLVYKAAKLVKDTYNIKEGVEIFIEKIIPIGAGLGGGSSDAAGVILYLNKFWGINAELDALNSLANKLGTDVPYFIKEGTAIASNKGEELDYFNSALNFAVLIIMPDVSISTKWAYENIKSEHFTKFKTDLKSTLAEAKTNKKVLKEKVFNNFELLIFENYPEIGRIKEELYNYGAVFALMSGSGASVYGLFETEDEARLASLKFNRYRNFVCEMI